MTPIRQGISDAVLAYLLPDKSLPKKPMTTSYSGSDYE
jgi:hypothetical protein